MPSNVPHALNDIHIGHTRTRPHPHGAALRWRYAGLLVSFLIAPGCQSQGAAPPPARVVEAPLQAQQEALNRIKTTVGLAGCDADAQCRTLPLGERSCGGPQAWIAWSTLRTDETLLRQQSEQLAAIQRQRYARSGEMSTCQIVPDPGAWCQAKRCALRSANAANTDT